MNISDALKLAGKAAASAGNAVNHFLDDAGQTVNTLLTKDELPADNGMASWDEDFKATVENAVKETSNPTSFVVSPSGECSRSTGQAITLSATTIKDEKVRGGERELPDFCHPSDKAALDAMKALPGFTQLMSFFTKNFPDRERHLSLMSTALKVGPKQAPEIYAPLKDICASFGIKEPEIYVQNNAQVNAFASGTVNHQIVLTTGLLNVVEPKELEAVLVHECGHIMSNHMLYLSWGQVLTTGALQAVLSKIPVAGAISGIAMMGLKAGYQYWSRCAELSADRAAALYYGSPDKTVSSIMRIAGGSSRYTANLDLDLYKQQGEDYLNEVGLDGLNLIYHLRDLVGASHPMHPVRVAELLRWTATDEYNEMKAKFNAFGIAA